MTKRAGNPESAGPVEREVLPEELRKRRDFYDALRLVDRSGIAELLEDATTTLSPAGKRMGRPRALTMRALVVVLQMLLLQRRQPTILAAHDLIENLPSVLLAEIGLHRNHGQVIALNKLDHLWNRLADAINDCPVVEGKRLWVRSDGVRVNVPRRHCLDPKALDSTLADEDAYTAPSRALSNRGEWRGLSDDHLEKRRQLRNELTDRYLRATVPDFPYQAAACDWTDVEVDASTYRHPKDAEGTKVKGPATRKNTTTVTVRSAERAELDGGEYGVLSADPTAAWGRRHSKGNALPARVTGAHPAADTDPDPHGGHEAMFFGHIFHAAVLVEAVGAEKLPPVICGVRGTPGDAMGTVAPMLNEIREAVAVPGGPHVDEFLVDLGYSQLSVDDIHRVFAEAGVFLTYDFKEHMYGPKGTFYGAPLVDGEPVCPSMPEELRHLVPPRFDAPRSKWSEYRQLRKLQDAFRFRRQGKLGPDLKVRFQCPALAGRVRCPNVEGSMALPVTADRPEVYDPPTEKLDCCGSSRVASFEVGTGLRQRHLHGSAEWQRSFDRRTVIERRFSVIKGILKLGEMRFLTLAKREFFFVLAAAAANVEEIRAWEDKTGEATGLLSPTAEWGPRSLDAAA